MQTTTTAAAPTTKITAAMKAALVAIHADAVAYGGYGARKTMVKNLQAMGLINHESASRRALTAAGLAAIS